MESKKQNMTEKEKNFLKYCQKNDARRLKLFLSSLNWIQDKDHFVLNDFCKGVSCSAPTGQKIIKDLMKLDIIIHKSTSRPIFYKPNINDPNDWGRLEQCVGWYYLKKIKLVL